VKHRLDRRLAVAVTTYLLTLFETAHTRTRDDRGEVVPALIIVAGFAALAVAFVLAVKGKVHGWIAKIPNP
jgi:mitochondrial fission protein ELM1